MLTGTNKYLSDSLMTDCYAACGFLVLWLESESEVA